MIARTATMNRLSAKGRMVDRKNLRRCAMSVGACLSGLALAGQFATAERVLASDAALIAAPWQSAHATRARLVGGGVDSSDAAAPAVLAGFEIQLEPKWKTYWRMPGDSGVPPQFDWSKSDNVANVAVLYPAPRRFTDASGDTVGYSTLVTFPMKVTPKDVTKPVTLKIEASFGVCKDICIPLDMAFTLSLPVPVAGAQPPAELADALAQVPRATDNARSSDPVITSIDGALGVAPQSLTITARHPGGAGQVVDIFVEAPEGYYVPAAKRGAASAKPGVQTFTLEFARPADGAELVGKPLRVTVVGPAGASETMFTPAR